MTENVIFLGGGVKPTLRGAPGSYISSTER